METTEADNNTKTQTGDASLEVHISSVKTAHRGGVTRTVQFLKALSHVAERFSLIHSVMTDVEKNKKTARITGI